MCARVRCTLLQREGVCVCTRALRSPAAWGGVCVHTCAALSWGVGGGDSLMVQLCLPGFLRLALQAAWVKACVPLPESHPRGGGAQGPVLGGAGLPSRRSVQGAPHTRVPG